MADAAVVTLVTLKLAEAITWSWWWVLWPVWIRGVLIVLLGHLAGVLVILWSLGQWPVTLVDLLRNRG